MGVGSSLLSPSKSSRSHTRFCPSLQALTCLLPVAITVRVMLPPPALCWFWLGWSSFSPR